jgi:phosphatase NudJ
MSREPIPTWYFALAVVRRGDRFLLVQEAKHGQGWFLPAGRVEPGESLVAAAERETMEEAGIRIRVTGVLRIEHTPSNHHARVRVFFLAEAVDDREPKSVADEESLGAAWATLADLKHIPLRGDEVSEVLHAVAAGWKAAPISLIQAEGVPWMG